MARMRHNYTPFLYAVDGRDNHICEMAGCAEPIAYSLLLRVELEDDEEEQDFDIGLCVEHFHTLQRTVAHPHGDETSHVAISGHDSD